MNQGGDDLEDDFVPDETVALSDEEGPGYAQLDDEDVFVDDEAQSPSEDDEGEETSNNAESAIAAKKRKRREKEKEKKAKRRKFAETVEVVQASVAAQPPHELAEYLSSIQVKSFTKLSAIELDDLRIPDSLIDSGYDSMDWSSDAGPIGRFYNEEWALSSVVQACLTLCYSALPSLRVRLAQRSKTNGAPTLMYIAGAALRVADVTRILKDRQLRGEKGGDVAKLFAKHFKLAQHVTFLKQTKVGVAVGTPGRLGKLLNETDALNLSALTHIILDITHKDAKNRNLLEIPETRDEVLRTVLNNDQLLKGIKDGKIQVVLF
ncbi:U3-containing 90S pre-ribosomal complex subunit-domain containing protein [Crepidotus variabilis]|uniref:U3-containing 90S pre-ribosomal complex subunit-domain containing protein n=1 Tax=Crepidotus variabilis TaxID=179855 RepID=A0A9P6ER21_9AGAR|nr:U3-containing 90S pre-ribosomal complex subunit-domain containing protein [Crepidotus variabilis]